MLIRSEASLHILVAPHKLRQVVLMKEEGSRSDEGGRNPFYELQELGQSVWYEDRKSVV